MKVLKPPPRDDNNHTLPHDHEEIKNSDDVIRRISSEQIVEKNGQKVISSLAYRKSSGENGGMSVDLKQLIEANDIEPKDWVTTPRWMGAVLFKVSSLRGMSFKVGYDPILTDPANPYHGEVWGGFKRSHVNKLKQSAKWFVSIEGVDLL